ncbi:cysteine desulfurase activator complex subunit SufD [Slackia heliotrinireducens]|uniref:ABC-type transport system involved in Fe-S cluster assembly, permease component n=1 Tax=Slackia heliotrinireducens (strain ATCC 29202 / DSM 20476 / NCTC 11029 / RHS 1) TaxID=471855 RepID=C7N3F6_SLAHD|nr:SufD family Fe-S cluster assembly protein [Slackia heliotrinireducens]ACV23679.1 ABC-type transport system involved in Fe-S cluster assembly, permease component [Slackia heliotrinireducens DSM 20476]VEH03225.1 cysteine desulfurase activator complex subunit SufD [Slackia heliotrinireducens]
MDAITLQHVNAMPAPTWHRLKMNDTDVELPEGLEQVCSVAMDVDAALIADEGAFELAMGEMQERFEAALAAAGPRVPLAGKPATSLDDTAYSNYQIAAAAAEAEEDVAATFETGMGNDTHAFLLEAAGAPTVIATQPGQTGAKATLHIDGIDGALNAAAIDVVAAPDSEIDVVIAFDTPEAGTGAIGATLRVFAGARSRVGITTVQTVDNDWITMDDEGYMVDDDARVEVVHTVLAGKNAYVGMAGDLRGKQADIDVQTHYLGHDENEIDFNYVLRHHGVRTTCELNAQGVLADASYKNLRGTIDLIKGAKGAVGHEVETVLITDDRAHNLTVPIILCSEDDVQGNHGATIGHIQPEQLFYLGSRGLSPEQAEDMFIRAQLERAAIYATDDQIAAGVARLGKALLGEFEEIGE